MTNDAYSDAALIKDIRNARQVSNGGLLKSEEVLGLLHRDCNKFLAFARNSTKIMSKMIDYLQRRPIAPTLEELLIVSLRW